MNAATSAAQRALQWPSGGMSSSVRLASRA
jgi:hypothetical protein